MAAAAVKIPLSVKKALRDNEAENKVQLEKLEKAVGLSPVTFNFNIEALWTALASNPSKQEDIPRALKYYVEPLREFFEKECKDAMTKESFHKYWTTKNITFTCEPESFVGADYCKTHMATWSGYCGIRFVKGDLDMFSKVDRFGSNSGHMYSEIKASELFANAAEDIPIALKKEIRDEQANITKVLARIAKAVGVDAVKWDVEADCKTLSAKKDLKWPFTVSMGVEYLNGLAECLEKKCADDMVKEAVVDAFSAKTVGIRAYDSNDGIKGLEVHSSYNGIQFLDGAIYVFGRTDNFGCNVNQVAYEHDIVKLF